MFIVLAYTLSITLTTPGYAPRFIDNTLLLLRNLATVAAIYTAIILAMDSELRDIAMKILAILKHRVLGQS